MYWGIFNKITGSINEDFILAPLRQGRHQGIEEKQIQPQLAEGGGKLGKNSQDMID